MALAACDEEGAAAVDYAPLLQSLTEKAALPHLQQFASDGKTLSTQLLAFETAPTADSLSTAQSAWRAARASFRKLDALHFGPVADLGYTERIDLAPADAADIEAVVAGADPIDAAFVGKLGGKEKGFLGIEHLLFSMEGASVALTKLTGDGAPARRRTLVRYMADEIASTATSLSGAWTGGERPFATEVETAGATSDRYPRQRGALDDFVAGVYYSLEWVVGVRLAEPLGRHATGMPDPAADFTRASDNAVADMTASIAGSRAVFESGMLSYLQDKAPAVAARAIADFDACGTKIAAIPARFDGTVVANTGVVQAAYDACKALKATWAAEVTSALGATFRVSDNDGD